jgi:hypothetical protein
MTASDDGEQRRPNALCFRNRGNLKAWPLSGRPEGSQLSEPSDPGPVSEPFATLAGSYPGPDPYDPQRLRVECGPIFHRGRLDGSAPTLVLGPRPRPAPVDRSPLPGRRGRRARPGHSLETTARSSSRPVSLAMPPPASRERNDMIERSGLAVTQPGLGQLMADEVQLQTGTCSRSEAAASRIAASSSP